MTLVDESSKIEDELRRRIAKLERINAALMTHVERVTDQPEGAYSLFQTAIMLDGRVRARTEELTTLMHELERSNGALKAAKDEAEHANRSKTRFLAAASHDLLQPLNAARLSISALGDMALDPGASVMVRQVERGLETIEDVIKTLLDISKLDAGIVHPDKKPVGLRDLFAELEASFRPLAAEKTLRLILRCPDDLVVDTDIRLLKRVVQNLASNAISYTRRGGVLIAARRRGKACAIDVIDTGFGIAESEHALIFEEFYRGKQSGDSGLGLGLAIVRRMLSTLGHRLDLWSRPGHGSRFRISLPLARNLPTQAAQPRRTQAVFARVRALVVENDKSTLEASTHLLTSWGIAVLAVADPTDIVEGREDLAPMIDVLLVDYHLGAGRIGLDVVVTIRAIMGREIPAIIVTADHTDEIEARVLAANCELVRKPVKPAQLRSLLSFMLS